MLNRLNNVLLLMGIPGLLAISFLDSAAVPLAGGPDALLAVANNSNPLDRPAELCEANFYIAEWYLTRKDEQMARAHFAAAIEICPREFQEYRAAKIELKKLKQ